MSSVPSVIGYTALLSGTNAGAFFRSLGPLSIGSLIARLHVLMHNEGVLGTVAASFSIGPSQDASLAALRRGRSLISSPVTDPTLGMPALSFELGANVSLPAFILPIGQIATDGPLAVQIGVTANTAGLFRVLVSVELSQQLPERFPTIPALL